uniref:Putative secreted peptide n=1 Tax=Anopheles braziliensis TaxID=58242 RepID=A0A2M3ZMM2_9DIPT
MMWVRSVFLLPGSVACHSSRNAPPRSVLPNLSAASWRLICQRFRRRYAAPPAHQMIPNQPFGRLRHHRSTFFAGQDRFPPRLLPLLRIPLRLLLLLPRLPALHRQQPVRLCKCSVL